MAEADPVVIDVGETITTVVVVVDDSVPDEGSPSDALAIVPLMRFVFYIYLFYLVP